MGGDAQQPFSQGAKLAVNRYYSPLNARKQLGFFNFSHLALLESVPSEALETSRNMGQTVQESSLCFQWPGFIVSVFILVWHL